MAEVHPTPHPDLAGFVLGALEPDEAAAFEAHLSGCATCRNEVDELAPLPALIDLAVPPVDLPPGLRERTIAAAVGERGRSATPGSQGRWRRSLAVVGALAAGVLLFALVSLRTGEDRATTTQVAVGAIDGTIEVERTRSGWRIDLELGLRRRADGRYYEAFLEGPAGRVSVGTFNEGHDVVLWSGVPPSAFNRFVIVERPGEVEVVRTRLRV